MSGIDHVVHCVQDLDAASAFYEAMGFTMTPQAQHPFGTGNRLAQLGGNFIELLSVTKLEDVPEAKDGAFSFGAYNRDVLEQSGECMSMLSLKTNSWQDDRHRFRTAGLPEYEPFGFGRTAKQPDGSEVKLDFRLSFATDDALPNAVFFTCDHRHPPSVFWKPDYQLHANSAKKIAEVYMVATDPMVHAPFLEKLFGETIQMDDGLLVPMGEEVLNVMTPAAILETLPGVNVPALTEGEARFVGYRVIVDDWSVLTAGLDRVEIVAASIAGNLVVAANIAFGTNIVFSSS